MILVGAYIWLEHRSEFISSRVMSGLVQASGTTVFRGSSLFLLKQPLPLLGKMPPRSRQRAVGSLFLPECWSAPRKGLITVQPRQPPQPQATPVPMGRGCSRMGYAQGGARLARGVVSGGKSWGKGRGGLFVALCSSL